MPSSSNEEYPYFSLANKGRYHDYTCISKMNEEGTSAYGLMNKDIGDNTKHSKDSADIFIASKKEGGRGIASFEDCIDATI